jgi:hypothetical protein
VLKQDNSLEKEGMLGPQGGVWNDAKPDKPARDEVLPLVHHRMRRTRGGTCPTELVEDLA